MSQTVYINGIKNDCLTLSNRSIHYGDGLFETILVKNGKLLLLDLHLNRIVNDSKKLFFKAVSAEKINELLQPIIINYPNAIVKLIIARNQKSRGYAVSDQSEFDSIVVINALPVKKMQLTAKICQTRLASQPLLAKIKHLNRLEQVLASNELEQGVDEGVLFLHKKDQLVETISSNIFVIKDDEISTPLLINAGVEGVAKKIIISTANKNGLVIKEKNINKHQLLNADSVFISNSIFGLRQLKQIDLIQYKTNHSVFNTLYNQTKSYFIE